MENKIHRHNIFNRGLLFLGLLFFLPLLGGAQPENPSSPEAIFAQANTYYEKGEYQAAITLYRHLVEEGYESGPLFYNLGNSYFKIGEKGYAVLYYEKARRLIPHDADLKANLTHALSGVEEGSISWWLALKSTLTHLAPLGTWIAAAAICYTLFFLCLILKMLMPALVTNPASQPKTWWRRSLIIAGVLLLLTASLAALTFLEQNTPQGVVLTAGVARFEPVAGASIHYHIFPATRVRILEEKGGWLLVRRFDGKRGWVEKQLVGEL